jgi:hypothetical protein
MEPPHASLQTTTVSSVAAQIVHAVYRYRFLTAPQLSRLFPGHPDAEEQALHRLVNAAYLTAIHRPTLDPIAPDVVYALAQRGADLVAERLGIDRRLIRWRKYHNLIGLPYLEHRLATNDVRVALTVGAPRVGGRLEYWWYEFLIRENVDDPDEHAPPLVLRPDAYAQCQASARRLHLFFEVDLATESNGRFGSKVRRYLAYKESTLFRARMGGRSFRVLIVVPSPARLRALKRVVEDQGGGRIFWLALRSDVTEEKIGEPVWQLAGEEVRAALFASPEAKTPSNGGSL